MCEGVPRLSVRSMNGGEKVARRCGPGQGGLLGGTPQAARGATRGAQLVQSAVANEKCRRVQPGISKSQSLLIFNCVSWPGKNSGKIGGEGWTHFLGFEIGDKRQLN